MGKFFLENNFTPVVCVPNDRHVIGIILRYPPGGYVCWGTRGPPPHRPTGRPIYPPPSTPPSRPPKVFAHVGCQDSNRPPLLCTPDVKCHEFWKLLGLCCNFPTLVALLYSGHCKASVVPLPYPSLELKTYC